MLATALYLPASDTFSVSAVTMGRNFSPSGARVLVAKKSVTEVSLPCTIFTASSTDIECTAFSSNGLASGTADSAARFIELTRSSTFCCWPSIFSIDAALLSAPGSGIRTCGLSRKPPGLPSSDTALSAPRSSAARTPEAASVSPSAKALTVSPSSARQAVRARKSVARAGVN